MSDDITPEVTPDEVAPVVDAPVVEEAPVVEDAPVADEAPVDFLDELIADVEELIEDIETEVDEEAAE